MLFDCYNKVHDSKFWDSCLRLDRLQILHAERRPANCGQQWSTEAVKHSTYHHGRVGTPCNPGWKSGIRSELDSPQWRSAQHSHLRTLWVARVSVLWVVWFPWSFWYHPQHVEITEGYPEQCCFSSRWSHPNKQPIRDVFNVRVQLSLCFSIFGVAILWCMLHCDDRSIEQWQPYIGRCRGSLFSKTGG